MAIVYDDEAPPPRSRFVYDDEAEQPPARSQGEPRRGSGRLPEGTVTTYDPNIPSARSQAKTSAFPRYMAQLARDAGTEALAGGGNLVQRAANVVETRDPGAFFTAPTTTGQAMRDWSHENILPDTPGTDAIREDIADHPLVQALRRGARKADQVVSPMIPEAARQPLADVAGVAADVLAVSPALGVGIAPRAAYAPGTRQASQLAGQEAGLVLPPATAKPSALWRTMESLAGKQRVQYLASEKNVPAVTRLIADDLGFPKDMPLTVDNLARYRATQGKAYQNLERAYGENLAIIHDAQYLKELDDLLKQSQQISQDFPDLPGLQPEEIGRLVQSLKDSGLTGSDFSAGGAMEAIKHLRAEASGNLSHAAAANPVNRRLGLAQRDAAAIVEDLIDRDAAKRAQTDMRFDGLLSAYRKARVNIAKSHSAEDALNPATGEIDARKLAAMDRKGKPLSGAFDTAAKFGGAFPKATTPLTDSGAANLMDSAYGATVAGGLNVLSGGDMAGAGGAAMLGAVGLPVAREVASRALLSKPVQKLLAPHTTEFTAKPGPIAGGLSAPALLAMLESGEIPPDPSMIARLLREYKKPASRLTREELNAMLTGK